MILYRLSPKARLDLLKIRDYISLDDPAAAERLIRNIKEKCQFLGKHPRLTAPQRQYMNLSKHKVGNYLIFYRPHKTGVEIIRILHMARDIESALLH
ncbi:MAG: type II toxin-antitoxin system RelE/ParE family toxin [Alphaproteobacteria bacterium]|nr:type II toxin-antitoxin system RelE/ParE family toxin [Alphaproteobacteria bacterium]